MKLRFTLIIAFAFLLVARLFAASGGPDAYGYTWRDSNEPNGPVPNWATPSSAAGWVQVAGLGDDNSVGSFAMNWDFHYYWGDYSSFRIGSNGWISFDNNVSNIASCFPSIPTPGGAGDLFIAPLLSDLTFTSNSGSFPNVGQVWYKTNNKDTLYVAYINTPWWQSGTPDWYGSNSFQILLDGTDSSITFTYLDMNSTWTQGGCTVDMVIGIENQTGAVGLSCFVETVPADNYAIKFDYPGTVLLSVKDLTPEFNLNIENGGVFYPTGLVPVLNSNIKNVGNTDVVNSTSITGRVKNLATTIVYTSTQTLPTLLTGEDSLLVFSPQAVLNTPGQYYWEVTLTNSQDINGANNVRTTEISMVNLSGPTAQLTYTTGGASGGSIGWNGGNTDDGVGIYIDPPVHPMDINSLEYYVASNAGESMIAAVFDDDGPNGSAGTMLWSDTIPAASITTAAWNTVTLPAPLTVTTGGFYVAWFMGGPNIFLGYETVGPISRRSFEILGGVWGGYRDNNLNELMMRVNIGNYTCAVTANFAPVNNNTTVNFTNTSTGATSYLWDFGDGNTSTALSPTHTYASTGTYTACLISTAACGSDTTCQTITVVCPLPSAGFSSVANGVTVTFTDTSSAGVTTWLWDFGDGNTSTQQNPIHTYSAQGTYNVCLISTSQCGSDTVCTQVVVCNLATANFISTSAGLTASFTNLTSGATTFFWTFGDGGTSTTQNPSHFYNQGGTYTVCLVATNICGADTFCQTVVICQPPVAAFTFVANQLVVNFTDNSNGTPTSWAWDFGDGGTSTQQNPQHTYTATGVFTVCMIATDACGSDTSCQTVNVTSIGLNNGQTLLGLQAWPNPGDGPLTVEVTLGAPGTSILRLTDLTGRTLAQMELAPGTTRTQLDLGTLPAGLYLLELESEGHHIAKPIIRE